MCNKNKKLGVKRGIVRYAPQKEIFQKWADGEKKKSEGRGDEEIGRLFFSFVVARNKKCIKKKLFERKNKRIVCYQGVMNTLGGSKIRISHRNRNFKGRIFPANHCSFKIQSNRLVRLCQKRTSHNDVVIVLPQTERIKVWVFFFT